MNLLLDTHTFLWWDENELPVRVVARIQKADQVFVSAVTAWEIAIKSGIGKLPARADVAQAIADYGFAELPIEVRHASGLRSLPLHHRDPFDRMLVAQAKAEGLAIVSRDPLLSRYPVHVVWA
ncbi:type II toxin-antitoxin system VapC family toxin [Pendulispora albinea]|uniref:Type II toxin-antitoxin system VapC family toxin n=1 Tax=Pendulispora albinea TaxID=2741071 RepID=A0ABZ2LZ54_9BACT